MTSLQKADNKIYLFEQSPIPKAVATLAVPTVLSQLVMVLYNLADTFWVGMLNNAVQNAAVTLAAPVLLAFNAINNLFGVGSSSMMSRALGRKDYETVSRSSAFGFYCSIICGIIFSLLCTVFQNPLLVLLGADETTMQATREYMFWTVNCGAVPAILNVVMAYLVRSEGSAMHASIGTMSGCLLNIVLDPVFILPWGFDMGAGGAGLATFLSNCVACLYFFVLLFIKRGNTFVCIDPKKLSFQKDIVSGVCAVGIPASIQNLLNVTGMTILNNFSSSYGASAVAAIGICQKIYMVPMYISQGISQGVMPLISYTFSSNNIPRMKHAVSFARKAALTIIISVALLFFLFPGFWVELFMNTAVICCAASAWDFHFCPSIFWRWASSRRWAWGASRCCLPSCARWFWRFRLCLFSTRCSGCTDLLPPSSVRRSSLPLRRFWCCAGCLSGWRRAFLPRRRGDDRRGPCPFRNPVFLYLDRPIEGLVAAAGRCGAFFFWALRPCLAARGDLCGAGNPCTHLRALLPAPRGDLCRTGGPCTYRCEEG